MKTILRLAFRNIGRNRRRSILALISVSLSLMLIVCLQGWITGVMQSIVKNYTKNETGHIRIATREYESRVKFSPVSDNLDNPEEITRTILDNQQLSRQIVMIAPRISFGVLLSNEGRNMAAMAIAGDPQKEKSLLMLQESLLPGSKYMESPNEAIIGFKLAERLGYKAGDTLKIVATGSDYALRMKKVTISGIYKTGINQIDENVFQIPITAARGLLGMQGEVQQLIIMLDNWRSSGQVAKEIRKLIPDTSIAVTPWTDIGDYYRMVRVSETAYNFIYLVVAFLGAFIISNIMMMVVLERRKEIGILKSMGMTAKQILGLFLTEGMILGFGGSVIGAAAGALIVSTLHITGVDLTSMMQGMKMPIDNVIYPQIGAAAVLRSLALGTVIAGLVSLLPSRQAAKMNAVEAIKSV